MPAAAAVLVAAASASSSSSSMHSRHDQPTHVCCVRACKRRSIEPELYPRPDGTVYVCGEPQALPLPPDGPAGVTVDAQRCQVLQVRECAWNRPAGAVRLLLHLAERLHVRRARTHSFCCLLAACPHTLSGCRGLAGVWAAGRAGGGAAGMLPAAVWQWAARHRQVRRRHRSLHVARMCALRLRLDG